MAVQLPTSSCKVNRRRAGELQGVDDGPNVVLDGARIPRRRVVVLQGVRGSELFASSAEGSANRLRVAGSHVGSSAPGRSGRR
jgi:hypothetical protein